MLAASLLFYSWGETTFVMVMLCSILANWFIGKQIELEKASRSWLIVGVGSNVILLVYFKYIGFILLSIFNFPPEQITTPHLPLGISFFTFQAISYLVDIYRKEAKAAGSLIEVGTYIAMFPQLIAGPIVRYQEVSKALVTRTVEPEQVRLGFLTFTVGLFQKLIFANSIGEIADEVFAHAETGGSALEAWLGIIAYSLQIFFDFAGYSNMAIGIGLLLGFIFPQNFNLPYISKSITEFWRRWHMTLSGWFRDYLYIPLGGNRKGALRTYRNLFIVFILCGAWHGASWIFIFWGCYHGFFLILERMGLAKIVKSLPTILQHMYALFVVMMGWVLFRSENVVLAKHYFLMLLGCLSGDDPHRNIWIYLDREKIIILFLAILFSSRFSTRCLDFVSSSISSQGQWLVAVCLYLCSGMYLANSSYHPFIYFRF